MKKTFSLKESIKLAKKLHTQKKRIVLVGGCFDILHIGHVQFLATARSLSDHLMVLLESDETVKRLKGEKRPINSQNDRAIVLAGLSAVNTVCLLPPLNGNDAYDSLVLQIKPAIIATTKADPFKKHKDRQAKIMGIKVVEIPKFPSPSTTDLIQKLCT